MRNSIECFCKISKYDIILSSVQSSICHPSDCTVVSGIVVVVVVVVIVGADVCNRSQMRTSKCTCLIFGVSIGLDPRNAQKEFLIGQSQLQYSA